MIGGNRINEELKAEAGEKTGELVPGLARKIAGVAGVDEERAVLFMEEEAVVEKVEEHEVALAGGVVHWKEAFKEN